MQPDDALLRALLIVLSSAPQPDAVARAVCVGTLRALQPQSVALHSAQGDVLELRSQHGLSPEAVRLVQQIPVAAATPESAVFTSGIALRADPEALPHRFPLVAHHDTHGPGLLLVQPLLHAAQPIGVVTLRVPNGAADEGATQRLLDATCAALALWLLVDAQSAPAPTGMARLRVSERQRQIIDGVRRGLTNAAIAGELGFSIGTVKADITAMSALLGAAGREDLLRKATRAGLAP